jgi:SAM-dependent methyltransferase
MKKRYENYSKLQSQLDLPFLETPEEHLIKIFGVINTIFGLREKSKQKFIDLGSGNGQIVIFAALNYQIKSTGFEINQELVKEAREQIKNIKKENFFNKKLVRKIRIIKTDFYQNSVNPFDFIYIYSLPTMQRYLKHVFSTAKRSAIIISYKYPLEGFEEILNFEYKLEFGNGEGKINTFFYKRL